MTASPVERYRLKETAMHVRHTKAIALVTMLLLNATAPALARRPDPELWHARTQQDSAESSSIVLLLDPAVLDSRSGAPVIFKGTITNKSAKNFHLSSWGVSFSDQAQQEHGGHKPLCRWRGTDQMTFSSPMLTEALLPGATYSGTFFSEILDGSALPGLCKGKIALYGSFAHVGQVEVRVVTEFTLSVLAGATEPASADQPPTMAKNPFSFMPVYHYVNDFFPWPFMEPP